MIKKKVPKKFSTPVESGNFWSDILKVNFVSATLNHKVETLGSKLMENYEKVGFDKNHNDE